MPLEAFSCEPGHHQRYGLTGAQDPSHTDASTFERRSARRRSAPTAQPHRLAVQLEGKLFRLCRDQRHPSAYHAPEPGLAQERRVRGQLFTNGPRSSACNKTARLVG